MCCKAEHKKHNVAGCTTFAPSEYTNRHTKVAGYIHWKVCELMGLQVTDRLLWTYTWKGHKCHSTTVMWDVPVITDQTILTNQPNI